MNKEKNEVVKEIVLPFHFSEKCYIITLSIVAEILSNQENCAVCSIPSPSRGLNEKCKIINATILHIKETKVEDPLKIDSKKGAELQEHIDHILIKHNMICCIDCLQLLWMLLDKEE